MLPVDKGEVSRSRYCQEMTRADHNRLLSRLIFKRFEMSLSAKLGNRHVLFLLALSLEKFHKTPFRVTLVSACYPLSMVSRGLFALMARLSSQYSNAFNNQCIIYISMPYFLFPFFVFLFYFYIFYIYLPIYYI